MLCVELFVSMIYVAMVYMEEILFCPFLFSSKQMSMRYFVLETITTNMTPNTDTSIRLINTIIQQTSSPDITFASSTKSEALNTKFRPLTKYILLDHNYNFHTLSLKKRIKYTQEFEIFLNKKQKYNIRQKIKSTQSESFRNEL